MTNETPPKAVVFDLGGVIVRICRSWKEACDRLGINDLTDEKNLNTQAHSDLVRLHQTDNIAHDEYYAGVAAERGGRHTALDAQRIHMGWITGEYPGALELVRELNAMPGIVTACLSNTNAPHWRAMLGLDQPAEPLAAQPSPALREIEVRMASQELRCVKPDEPIYRAAERVLDLQGPDIAFFDDTQENVEAARSIGWRTELIDHAGDPPSQMRRALAAWGLELENTTV